MSSTILKTADAVAISVSAWILIEKGALGHPSAPFVFVLLELELQDYGISTESVAQLLLARMVP